MNLSALRPRLAGNGTAAPTERGWKLTIPPGDDKTYRLAQVEDHPDVARNSLPWRPVTTVQLRARASGEDLPGTWGFGLWNNPFGLACGPTAESRRLPTLPHSAWYFSASPKSYLSLRDDGPGNGFFAQVFRSARAGIWLLPVALTFPFSSAMARRKLGLKIQEDAVGVTADAREWHVYRIEWNQTSTIFTVDGRVILTTRLAPRKPLGLIMWIDNQFARFDPQGRTTWGVEACPTESWLEIQDLTVSSSAVSLES
jgi:hypothetical protein